MSGYTKVDNWLFDEVMPKADPGEYKIVSAVYRKTVGWKKTEDKISITQFQKMTGIAGRNNIVRAIHSAIDNEFITRRPSGQGFIYQCQLVTNQHQPTSNESLLASNESLPVTSNDSLPATSNESVHTKEKEKENILKLVDRWCKLTGRKPSRNDEQAREEYGEPAQTILIRSDWDLETAWQHLITVRDEMLGRGYTPIKLSGIVPHAIAQLDGLRPSTNGNGPGKPEHGQPVDDESGGYYV